MKKIPGIFLGLLIAVIALLALQALFSWLLWSGLRSHGKETDVTSSPEYNFKSFAGTVWKTKVKVALADLKEYTGVHHIYLLTPRAFDPTHPEYTPPNSMEKVIAVLPVGTRVRIERLMKDDGIAGLLWVTASLEDGPTASTEHGKVVYLSNYFFRAKNPFIGRDHPDSKEWGVDPDMLEKAEGK